MNKLKRYKVTVLHVRRKSDDEVYPQEGDKFFGFSHNVHEIGKHFDMWLTNHRLDDPDNYFGFNRIIRMFKHSKLDGLFIATKQFKLLVEDADAVTLM